MTETVSVSLSELSLEQLVQVSQGIGHDIERLRAQRAHIRRHIDSRLALGERTSTADESESVAPGAVISASAQA